MSGSFDSRSKYSNEPIEEFDAILESAQEGQVFEKVEKVHIIKSQMVYKILTFQVGNFRDVFGFGEVSPPMASRLKDCCG